MLMATQDPVQAGYIVDSLISCSGIVAVTCFEPGTSWFTAQSLFTTQSLSHYAIPTIFIRKLVAQHLGLCLSMWPPG